MWAGQYWAVMDARDVEWLTIDASYIKAHPHSAGARGANQSIARTKGGLNSKVHLAVDSHRMPARLAVSGGYGCRLLPGLPLIEGIEAECLLAALSQPKGCDTNEIIATVLELGMDPVILPKSNRRENRNYDRALYKLRHLVENGFLEFKQ